MIRAASVLAVLALMVALPAAARQPAQYSITPDNPAVFGGTVTFTYAPDPVAGNLVLSCYQGGVLVSSEQHAANAEGWDYHHAFTLGGTYLWQSGAASCTAELRVVTHGHKVETVASTTFDVAP